MIETTLLAVVVFAALVFVAVVIGHAVDGGGRPTPRPVKFPGWHERPPSPDGMAEVIGRTVRWVQVGPAWVRQGEGHIVGVEINHHPNNWTHDVWVRLDSGDVIAWPEIVWIDRPGRTITDDAVE